MMVRMLNEKCAMVNSLIKKFLFICILLNYGVVVHLYIYIKGSHHPTDVFCL